jgi:hypothetical protein
MTENFAFTYQQSKCVCKVSPKPILFVVYVKKTKIVMSNALFLAQNFVFLHAPYNTAICCETTLWASSSRRYHITRQFVVKQLCGHLAHEDVRANF